MFGINCPNCAESIIVPIGVKKLNSNTTLVDLLCVHCLMVMTAEVVEEVITPDPLVKVIIGNIEFIRNEIAVIHSIHTIAEIKQSEVISFVNANSNVGYTFLVPSKFAGRVFYSEHFQSEHAYKGLKVGQVHMTELYGGVTRRLRARASFTDTDNVFNEFIVPIEAVDQLLAITPHYYQKTIAQLQKLKTDFAGYDYIHIHLV